MRLHAQTVFRIQLNICNEKKINLLNEHHSEIIAK